MAVVSTELWGVRDLLLALGWKPSRLGFLRFSGLIAAIMLGFIGLAALVGEATGISPLILQVALWVAWLSWLGYFFPRHQERDLAAGGNAYKRAFWREIWLGIGFNFATLLRPFTVGVLEGGGVAGSPLNLVVGLLLAGIGLAVILDASHRLGLSCAFFVYEYARDTTPPVIDRGVYGWIRHPLMAGGICVSIGLAIVVGTPTALELAVINTVAVLPYLPVEDHRCSRVVGSRYARYREEVGGILPRSQRVLTASKAAQTQDRPA